MRIQCLLLMHHGYEFFTVRYQEDTTREHINLIDVISTMHDTSEKTQEIEGERGNDVTRKRIVLY